MDYLDVGAAERPVALEGPRLTVGADPSNDIAIDDDPFASRLHAVVERHPAGWLIRDLGSRNGTYVNGEPIAGERALRSGDTILVGHTTIGFRSDTDDARTTLPAPDAQRHTASFVREGDYWSLQFGGHTSLVRDSKGMRYLAALLATPGTEVHALDLAPETGDTGDAGEVLDTRAKAAYRERLRDLAEDLEEAQAFNDSERAARAQEEIDALTDQLAGAVGLGGRDRRAASAAERARLNVTRAVRAALRRIAEADDHAGRHLEVSVHTGVFCCYRPDPAASTTWRVSGS